MRRIKQVVSELLGEGGITHPPINVEEIASRYGIELLPQQFDDDLSGFLYRQGHRTIIAVNTGHRETRQRFTIAHELGHYFLTPKEGVFVDQGILHFRDMESSEGTNREEIQANAFAAELLMPEAFIHQDVHETPWILDDEEALQKLADRYEVSLQALVIRLTKLGYAIMSE